LIPSGFDVDKFAPQPSARAAVRAILNLSHESRIVGLVARYHPMKDHLMFLNAAAKVHAAHPDVQFVLAGRGIDTGNQCLTLRIAELGISSCVHLVGVWPDMPQLLAGLDVACCSSYSEGLPNAIGEAMACAIPCVSTDAGDCAALIGDTGAVVPVGSADAFGAALSKLLGLSSSDRQSMGAAARSRIAKTYAISTVTRRYEDLYADLAAVPAEPGYR
jgi:glycosyltransferase involved in cell wall biosynthesis